MISLLALRQPADTTTQESNFCRELGSLWHRIRYDKYDCPDVICASVVVVVLLFAICECAQVTMLSDLAMVRIRVWLGLGFGSGLELGSGLCHDDLVDPLDLACSKSSL